MSQIRCRHHAPAFLVVAALTANVTSAATWYVDPDATSPVTDKVCSVDLATPCDTDAECAELEVGSCILLSGSTTSWCNAAISLQDVLVSAGLFDTIMVADGTYLPDSTGLDDPRDATFRLPISNVEIKGGYAGCDAVDEDARDFILFESILSGDIGVPDDNSDNCLHVVTGNGAFNSSILDGFTITAGNASGSSTPAGVGGGMLNDRGSPSVRKCTFRNNAANTGGGGVYNKGDAGARSTPRFESCIFDRNTAVFSGGGVYNIDADSAFTNCLFSRNRANSSFGGAVRNDGSIPIFFNCTIVDNFALGAGGGIYFGTSQATVIHSIIWGNADNSTLPLEQQQLAVFESSFLLIDFSAVQGCTVGRFCDADLNNIGNDPFLDNPYFVPGPIGCYYLSDTNAGEPFDSACIDAGGDLAANVSLGDGTTLADRTTQSFEELDSSDVDLGYHYPDTAAPVDPDTGLKFLLSDHDRDGVVDLFDYDEFADCLSGPDSLGGADGDEVPPCCRIFDYELDGDVDLDDFAGFQMSFLPP